MSILFVNPMFYYVSEASNPNKDNYAVSVYGNRYSFEDKNGKEIYETVEDLFNNCSAYHIDERTGKEYGYTKDEILTYDSKNDTLKYTPVNYVYRHKCSKPKWEIEDENGNIICVTEDHSCMVERDGKLICVKPSEILDTDYLITISDK